MDVSVIIVNWNAGAVLEACLASLPAALGGLQAETWVVDNASTDGSPAKDAGGCDGRRSFRGLRVLHQGWRERPYVHGL